MVMELIPAKTIVSGYGHGRNWFGNNYNMNIYRGCSHGCIYCDSRSECYRVENFDQVRGKENALEIIERDLQSKRRTGVIGTGAMSDPYNPWEEKYRLTRGALELVDRYRFGISICTKSDLVTRDIDILKKIQAHSSVLVKITITAWEDELCRKVEPNAPSPSRRFAALAELSRQGIHTCILLMPVLPFIEDNQENILGIVARAKASGVNFIFPGFGVTLRQNQRDWYYQKLDRHFPGLKQRYIQLYGNTYDCHSPRARELWKLFQLECDRSGIVYRMDEIIRTYKKGYEIQQLSLFS
jgi:DNA repair photolyase